MYAPAETFAELPPNHGYMQEVVAAQYTLFSPHDPQSLVRISLP